MFQKIIRKLKLAFVPCQENRYRPRFLESQFLTYCIITLLILKLLTLPLIIYLPKSIFFADFTRTALIKLTNSGRESFGIQPLKESPILNTAAYLKAKDMLEKDYFSHYSPEGISPWHWFKVAGYNYQFAGENLAIGFLHSDEVHEAWMQSSKHKNNILNPNYQEIGIAILKGDFNGNEVTVAVQMFGTPIAPTAEKVAQQPLKEMVPPEETILPGEIVLPEEMVLPEEIVTPEEMVTPEEIVLPAEISEEKTPSEPLLLPEKMEAKDVIALNLLQFVSSKYHILLDGIIYGFLVIIILSLLIAIFFDIFIYRKFEIQYKDLIFKSIGFSLLLIIFLFLDKLKIIQLISHNFSIY